jgi:hypothetical protein
MDKKEKLLIVMAVLLTFGVGFLYGYWVGHAEATGLCVDMFNELCFAGGSYYG